MSNPKAPEMSAEEMARIKKAWGEGLAASPEQIQDYYDDINVRSSTGHHSSGPMVLGRVGKAAPVKKDEDGGDAETVEMAATRKQTEFLRGSK